MKLKKKKNTWMATCKNNGYDTGMGTVLKLRADLKYVFACFVWFEDRES